MSEAKPSFEVEQRIVRAREREACRYIAHFFAKMREAGVKNPEKDRAALEKAIDVVRNASQEQWQKLAKDIGEKNPPSGNTLGIIVRRLETFITDLDREKRQLEEDIELVAHSMSREGQQEQAEIHDEVAKAERERRFQR